MIDSDKCPRIGLLWGLKLTRNWFQDWPNPPGIATAGVLTQRCLSWSHRLALGGKDLFGPSCGRWTPDGRNFVFQTGWVGYSEIWAISERPGFLHRPNLFPTRLTNGALSCNMPTPSVDGTQVFARCDKLRGELVRYDRGLNQFIPFLGGISATDVTGASSGRASSSLRWPDRAARRSFWAESDRDIWLPRTLCDPQW